MSDLVNAAAVRLSRSEVRQIACPACGVGRGEHCRRRRGGIRESNHRERVQAAALAHLTPALPSPTSG